MESWTETFSPREHSGVLDGDVHSKQVQESSGQTPRLKVVVETRWRRLDPRKSKRTFKIKITTEIVGHPRMPRNSSNPKGFRESRGDLRVQANTQADSRVPSVSRGRPSGPDKCSRCYVSPGGTFGTKRTLKVFRECWGDLRVQGDQANTQAA